MLSVSFDPQPGKLNITGRKIAIRGHLSADSDYLAYWFDFVPQDFVSIQLTNEKDIVNLRKDLEIRGVRERRNIRMHGVNLKLSGLKGDTGRAIAIDKIKHELKSIIKKRQLIESKYLLVERVSACKKRIKKINHMDNLQEMQAFVDSAVDAVMQKSPYTEGYMLNNIDMLGFQKLLTLLNEMRVDYLDCILPAEDQRLDGQGSCWVWDLYSDEQKIKRISKFFYFHQLMTMVYFCCSGGMCS